MDTEILLFLTPVGIIFVFAIREFFAYLKEKEKANNIKKEEGVKFIDNEQAVQIGKIEERLKAIQDLTENHIAHIRDDINEIKKELKEVCLKVNRL